MAGCLVLAVGLGTVPSKVVGVGLHVRVSVSARVARKGWETCGGKAPWMGVSVCTGACV